MKAKDLQPAYTWEDRHVVLRDRVLFIPKFYQKHKEFGPLDLESLFGNTNETIVEYCSGNGSWIIDKAKKNPGQNWVAVEKKFERAAKIWSKMKNENIDNLLIVYGDAFDFTDYYLKDSVLSEAYVNFPDPWPKDKHAKHRLLQEKFFTQLRKVLKVGGTITIATDDFPYTEQICLEILQDPNWESTIPSPHYTNEWKDYGTSFFELLWRSKGKQIHYMKFKAK